MPRRSLRLFVVAVALAAAATSRRTSTLTDAVVAGCEPHQPGPGHRGPAPAGASRPPTRRRGALVAGGAAAVAVAVAVLSFVGVSLAGGAAARHRAARALDDQLRGTVPVAPPASPTTFSWETATPPTVAPGDPVVRLEIPAIGLGTVVVEGVDGDQLNTAPGHDPHSVYPGVDDNSVISGHRDRQFAALRHITVGDAIVTRAPYGTYRWQVSAIRIVDKDDRTVIVPTRPVARLTLTTCYPFTFWGHAPKRFVVTARLAGGEQPYGQRAAPVGA